MQLLKTDDSDEGNLGLLKMVHFPKTDTKVLRDYWERILEEYAHQRLIEAVRDTLKSGEHTVHDERTFNLPDSGDGS